MIMPQYVKQGIAILGCGILVYVAYYGSYLPVHKSGLFITSLRESANVRTVQGVFDAFSPSLSAPSPIGQEELIRNTASNILGVVQQVEDVRVVDELVSYIDTLYRPIIERGSGMSFNQNLYLLGAAHEVAYIKTKTPRHLEAAFAYFSRGLELSPNRPQFLYGLLDVYRLQGNEVRARETADQIMRLWPEETRLRELMALPPTLKK